jgi:enolase-phosphatase E1
VITSQEKINTILLDIEGTTTPIRFVYEVLFAYARARVKDFLVHHFSNEGV